MTYTAFMDGIELTPTSIPLSYDSASQTFSIYSEDLSMAGAHDISLIGEFADYLAGISKEYTFTLSIAELCLDPISLNASADLED